MNFSIGQVDVKISFPKLSTGWSMSLEIEAPVADKYLNLYLDIAENNDRPFTIRATIEKVKEVG